MDLTRKQLTNVVKAEGLHTPMNTFVSLATFPPTDMKVVVRPNFDTLYSSAWLDLTKEPMIVSVPNTHGRYYLLPMLDMWTDVFASPGWRTLEPRPATMPWCRRAGAARYRQAWFDSTATPYVWIIGRIKTDGPPDYDAVHRFRPTLRSRQSRGGAWPPNRWPAPSIPVST